MKDDIKQWTGPIAAPSAAELADRYAISQLVKVYCLGIDMRDLDLVRSVFFEDAYVDGVAGALKASDYLPKVYNGAGEYASTQHNIMNQYITVNGDEAFMWSYAIAYHMEEKGNGRQNLIVGVNYKDSCRRTPKGWLIYHRNSRLQWIDGPHPRAK